MEHSIAEIEQQLRLRLAYPYRWGRKQNDLWDGYTQYVYTTFQWDALVEKMKATCERHALNKHELFQYAANRWYNYWHSVAVEHLFSTFGSVKRAENEKDREKDFYFYGIPFDHKTSVFPKQFTGRFHEVQKNATSLLYWLYEKQSSQQRYHTQNRLFLIVHRSDGAHWKLKCELGLVKEHIEKYAANFTRSQLQTLTFANGATALSDIIWVTQ